MSRAGLEPIPRRDKRRVRRERWRPDCEGKTRYRDLKEAKAAAGLIRHGSGIDLRIYECLRCKGLHLSSQEANSP